MSVVYFVAAALVGVEWGIAENRLFSDKPLTFDKVILNHFKTYHLFMAVLFGTINALAAAALTGETFSFRGLAVWSFLMVWDTLILDVTWWVIRYLDFKLRPSYAKVLYYPEKNAWHLQTDWDNWLGLPLILGFYWWWHLFAAMLLVLGVGVFA